MNNDSCPLCHPAGESVLWSDARRRRGSRGNAPFAGLCRVVWSNHVREFTDLDEDDRLHVMRVVAAVERALRDLVEPDKMNVASLGNQVPHLHWHVIPRFADDSHYPDAIWGEARRRGVVRTLPAGFPTEMARRLAVALGSG